jgi:Amt family ammonium transporter
MGQLALLAAMAGFLLYYTGLTRAKNCGHGATLVLLGTVFALIGFWVGGFAVEMGGVGDAHAAITRMEAMPLDRGTLDHELGLPAMDHHWGLMGSEGFFLETATGSSAPLWMPFLLQAGLLVLAAGAAMGGWLERGRLTAAAVGAFLLGVLLEPLIGNWTWGGGWLAQLGAQGDLGHGLVDQAGAGVVHEVGGTLALVAAMVLGPRHRRFGPNGANLLAAHNIPFVVVGASILLLALTAANTLGAAPHGLAGMVNTLLAASGGVAAAFFFRSRRPMVLPIRLTRGLLAGAVAISAGSGLVDPWAAFVIGGVAGLLANGIVGFLEHRRIDDPANVFAVHGVGGIWGLLSVGLLASGTLGDGVNGVKGPVRGMLDGFPDQLGAQAIGAGVIFLVVVLAGYVGLTLVQKIIGARVPVADEVAGLDFAQTGAPGYQGDGEDEE